eukprot:scaffold1828_cov272-Chaetoceros_neogracile.AAC.23
MFPNKIKNTIDSCAHCRMLHILLSHVIELEDNFSCLQIPSIPVLFPNSRIALNRTNISSPIAAPCHPASESSVKQPGKGQRATSDNSAAPRGMRQVHTQLLNSPKSRNVLNVD